MYFYESPEVFVFLFLGERDLAKMSFGHSKIPTLLAHFIWVTALW